MAITKIHPIKTTLNLSIDYICDSTKTDEAILISSHRCGYKTAALEFAKTKELTNSQCKNLARHLIQSFMPGEVIPEEAHQIGKALCEEHLDGRYEFVLTTHIDKGHIHNHIIFNNVSFIDGKSYISNKRSYHKIRNISDDLCKTNGLSIATELPSSQIRTITNGTSYKEHQERKKGNSYKAKLQYSIDLAIKSAKDWEDFLRILQRNGYEIKHGKHISFRSIGQERFTRSKTIGTDYTEEVIRERIESMKNSRLNKKSVIRHSASKVVDIPTNQLAQESTGFARWRKLQNLKVMAKSWTTITNNEVSDLNSFYAHIDQVHDRLSDIQSKIRTVESEIRESKATIQAIRTFNLYSKIYDNYHTANDKDKFFRLHEKEIILFEAAKQSLENSISPMLLSSIPELTQHIKKINSKHQNLCSDLTSTKKQVSEVNQLRSNLDTYLRSRVDLGYDKSDRSS